MKRTVKTDSDKIKSVIEMVNHLDEEVDYYRFKNHYAGKLLPIFSDGSNHGMLRANLAAFIIQYQDIFSLYGITVIYRSTIYYSGKPVYW